MRYWRVFIAFHLRAKISGQLLKPYLSHAYDLEKLVKHHQSYWWTGISGSERGKGGKSTKNAFGPREEGSRADRDSTPKRPNVQLSGRINPTGIFRAIDLVQGFQTSVKLGNDWGMIGE